MQELQAIITDMSVQFRNKMRNDCKDQVNAAIRAGDRVKAVIFVLSIFDTNLTQANSIVDRVREGECVSTAHILDM